MARTPSGTTPDQLSLEDCTNSRSGRAHRRTTKAGPARSPSSRHHHTAQELLRIPDALLTRTHLRELGLERRAVDAVFRILPVVVLPGYSRPMVRAQEYLGLIAQSTYNGDRVRP
jgi:hypothetical protein